MLIYSFTHLKSRRLDPLFFLRLFSLTDSFARSFSWSLFNRNNIRIEWASDPRLSPMSHSSRRVNIPLNTSNLCSQRQGHSLVVCICVKRERERKRKRIAYSSDSTRETKEKTSLLLAVHCIWSEAFLPRSWPSLFTAAGYWWSFFLSIRAKSSTIADSSEDSTRDIRISSNWVPINAH